MLDSCCEESLEGDVEAGEDSYSSVSFYFGFVLKSTRCEWTFVWCDKRQTILRKIQSKTSQILRNQNFTEVKSSLDQRIIMSLC